MIIFEKKLLKNLFPSESLKGTEDDEEAAIEIGEKETQIKLRLDKYQAVDVVDWRKLKYTGTHTHMLIK